MILPASVLYGLEPYRKDGLSFLREALFFFLCNALFSREIPEKEKP